MGYYTTINKIRLGPTQVSILLALKDGPKSIKEIAEGVPLDYKEDFGVRLRYKKVYSAFKRLEKYKLFTVDLFTYPEDEFKWALSKKAQEIVVILRGKVE